MAVELLKEGGRSSSSSSLSGGRGVCWASLGDSKGEGEEGESCAKGSMSSDRLKEELMVVGESQREGEDKIASRPRRRS